MKKLFFDGFHGEIRKPITKVSESLILELNTNQSFPAPQACLISQIKISLEEVQDYFGSAYKAWGRFGHMGDVIAISEIENNGGYIYVLDYIGNLAPVKPGLAVDLLLIIKTGPTDYYLVGIKRKREPGKGLPAFVGGWIDVRGYHLDTPIEAVVNEAEEEIGLQIKVVNQEDLLNPLPQKVAVSVDYQGKDFDGQLLFRGIVPTGDNEKILSVGLKRVYQTTVYALLLDMTTANLDYGKIKQWLKAGDDADELVITNLADSQNLRFGLEHHERIFTALTKDWDRIKF